MGPTLGAAAHPLKRPKPAASGGRAGLGLRTRSGQLFFFALAFFAGLRAVLPAAAFGAFTVFFVVFFFAGMNTSSPET